MISAQLELFKSRTESAGGRSWGSLPFSFHHPGTGRHERHVVLGFLIHGNEHGTLPAALRLQEELQERRLEPGGPVTLLIGNPEAARKDERFLEEDFNRVFTFDRPATSLERRRAEAVRPLLDSAHFFLDFHQTQTPTYSPFWTFPWNEELALWARALAIAPVGLTRKAGQAFSPGLCCLDEYVRNRGQLGLTVEVGFRGADPVQAELAYQGARRLLQLIDALQSGETSLENAALAQAELSWFSTTHTIRTTSPELRLRPGLQNFSPIQQGERLSADGSPELHAPASGVALFPKYPAPGQAPPPELLHLAEPVANPSVWS